MLAPSCLPIRPLVAPTNPSVGSLSAGVQSEPQLSKRKSDSAALIYIKSNHAAGATEALASQLTSTLTTWPRWRSSPARWARLARSLATLASRCSARTASPSRCCRERLSGMATRRRARPCRLAAIAVSSRARHRPVARRRPRGC